MLLERLGAGGMGQVFRARDRLGAVVALKQLAVSHRPGQEPASAAPARALGMATAPATERSGEVAIGIVPASPLARPIEATLGLALAREFRALRSLHHPNVVEVLDYGFDRCAGPYFTMKLLEEAVPITTAAAGAPFETKLALVGQLLRAMRYIHSRGVVHRDISANNVLVERGTVKLLDFGLAVLREDCDARLARWGTRGYRAPELARGEPATARSDLFAVGVLALQILVEQQVHDPADIERALHVVDPRVRALLVALTRDDWRHRPHDAAQVLETLATATGVALSVDTAATLESALTSAELVGRDRELETFDAALRGLTSAGAGSAWRLHGESGIGKSRLMDELRTRALVAGCVVLEGEALQEGGGAYEALAGIVRGLAQEVELSATEAHALLPVLDVTKMVRVTPEEVAPSGQDPAADDPENVRSRLFAVIDALLRRIGSYDSPKPVVLLLDDLQWATQAALGLVARIASLAATTPLLVIASHRDGESAAPEVERTLAGLPAVRVERLDGDAAAQLVRSAIHDASSELAALMARESEGHPFFLLELLRWTAEHGRTTSVSTERRLPERIGALVRSRLELLHDRHRVLFQVAAVIGREIDPRLVGTIGDADDDVVEAWVRAGLVAGLLEIRGGRLRFAHDMLREGVVLTSSAEERRRWHLRTGEHIERCAADPVAQSAALAHHFASAGDRVRTARWAASAGERALASGANAEAIRLLREALHAASADDDPLHRARLHRLIGTAHRRIGDYSAAHERGLAALAELGRAPPSVRRRAGQMAMDTVLLLARAGRRSVRPRSAQIDEALLSHYHVSETAFLRDAPLDLCWSLLRTLVLAEGGPPDAQVTVYSAAGLFAGTLRMDRVANAWSSHAIALSEELGSSALLASALHRRGVCAVVRAEWGRARDLLVRARETATRGEDRRQWQETTTVLGLVAAYRGDLAHAAALLGEVHQSAMTNGDRQGVLWGGPIAALCHLRLGESARAGVLLAETRAHLDDATSVYDRINFHGPRALQLFGAGERAAAIGEAVRVIDLLAQMRLSAYWTFHGLDAALATLFAALEHEEDPHMRRRLARDVARGCAEGRRLARFCVFAAPSALLWEGQRLVLAGRLRGARVRWARAEAIARRHDLPSVAEAARRLREG